jgi:hypothetical protein
MLLALACGARPAPPPLALFSAALGGNMSLIRFALLCASLSSPADRSLAVPEMQISWAVPSPTPTPADMLLALPCHERHDTPYLPSPPPPALFSASSRLEIQTLTPGGWPLFLRRGEGEHTHEGPRTKPLGCFGYQRKEGKGCGVRNDPVPRRGPGRFLWWCGEEERPLAKRASARRCVFYDDAIRSDVMTLNLRDSLKLVLPVSRKKPKQCRKNGKKLRTADMRVLEPAIAVSKAACAANSAASAILCQPRSVSNSTLV